MAMSELVEPFERMLESVASSAKVRAIESGASIIPLWQEFSDSGFLDALVPECDGGFGLNLKDVGPLFQALGRNAVPAPVAETMVARALLAAAGLTWPQGPIALANGSAGRRSVVRFGMVADHILVDLGEHLMLIDADEGSRQPTGVKNDLSAWMVWDSQSHGISLSPPIGGIRPVAALISSAAIAGAASRVLALTTDYANERRQFGKPIGRQQAIQQQLSAMAEDVISSRIAVELACEDAFPPRVAKAATAKIITGSAATRIANTAHAVHGAIGISEEFDLQLYTRRLHAERLSHGSDQYWSEHLGELRLSSQKTSIEWVRSELFAPAVKL